MKQLGNLAIICAKRSEVLMQIYNGQVFVHVGTGSQQAIMRASWDNDAAIDHIIHELNFGQYCGKEALHHAA